MGFADGPTSTALDGLDDGNFGPVHSGVQLPDDYCSGDENHRGLPPKPDGQEKERHHQSDPDNSPLFSIHLLSTILPIARWLLQQFDEVWWRGIVRAEFDGRLQRPAGLLGMLVSFEDGSLRHPDGVPLRPAALHFDQ